MGKSQQTRKPATQAQTQSKPKTEAPKTEKKTGGTPGRKLVFGENEVGVAYIAEAVGTTPFLVREYLRANVRDMEVAKGQAYKFTKDEAAEIIKAMKEKASKPRTRKSKGEGGEKKKKAAPQESAEVASLEDIEAELEDLESDDFEGIEDYE